MVGDGAGLEGMDCLSKGLRPPFSHILTDWVSRERATSEMKRESVPAMLSERQFLDVIVVW